MLGVTAAIVCGVLVSLAAPALALAHGHAHAELVEHAGDGHHGDHSEGVATIGADEHHDHGHATVDRTRLSRVAQSLAVLPFTPATYDLPGWRTGVAAEPPAACESPPDSLRAPPSRPRPPPVC